MRETIAKLTPEDRFSQDLTIIDGELTRHILNIILGETCCHS